MNNNKLITINLKQYINSLSIESTSHKDIFTYINKDNALEYTLESLELDINKYNRLITNGIRENDRFILESISFLNNVSLEEGNIFTKIIEGAKKIIKIIFDKIVEFGKWIINLFKKFWNWIRGTNKKMTDSIEIKRAEKAILSFLGDSVNLNLNETIELNMYNWRTISNLFGQYESYRSRWDRYFDIYKKKEKAANEKQIAMVEAMRNELTKATNGQKGLHYMWEVWTKRDQQDMKPEFEKYEKLFGKSKIKAMALAGAGYIRMQIQDQIAAYAETFDTLFEFLEIDIDEVELDNFSVKDLDQKINLLFFETQAPVYGKREVSLREFATPANLSFLKNYSSWKKEMVEEETKHSFYIEEQTRYLTHKQNKVKEYRKALEQFIKQLETWDGKEAIISDHPEDNILNTNRFKTWDDLTVKDKEKIAAYAIAEVKALNTATVGFQIIDHQIYIALHKNIMKISSMLHKDILNMIYKIRYNEEAPEPQTDNL